MNRLDYVLARTVIENHITKCDNRVAQKWARFRVSGWQYPSPAQQACVAQILINSWNTYCITCFPLSSRALEWLEILPFFFFYNLPLLLIFYLYMGLYVTIVELHKTMLLALQARLSKYVIIYFKLVQRTLRISQCSWNV